MSCLLLAHMNMHILGPIFGLIITSSFLHLLDSTLIEIFAGEIEEFILSELKDKSITISMICFL